MILTLQGAMILLLRNLPTDCLYSKTATYYDYSSSGSPKANRDCVEKDLSHDMLGNTNALQSTSKLNFTEAANFKHTLVTCDLY